MGSVGSFFLFPTIMRARARGGWRSAEVRCHKVTHSFLGYAVRGKRRNLLIVSLGAGSAGLVGDSRRDAVEVEDVVVVRVVVPVGGFLHVAGPLRE